MTATICSGRCSKFWWISLHFLCWLLRSNNWLGRLGLRLGLGLLVLSKGAEDLDLLSLPDGRTRLGLSLEQIQSLARLLGKVRHGLELVLPELRDPDRFLLCFWTFDGHPLLVGVLHHLSKIIWMHCVENVEKVLPGRTFVLRIGVRDVLH